MDEGMEAEQVEGQQLETLKAAWRVQAGVIPGKGMEQYDKLFVYTGSDREIDEKNAMNPAYQTIFHARQFEAMCYHLQMSNPSLNNWAEITFTWF